MFSYIKIKNFQSYEDSILNLSQGVNVIVPEDMSNPSTIGKTAIKRALELLCFNKPGGARYFSNFKKKGITEIAVGIAQGNEIKLKKEISVKGSIKKIVSAEYQIDESEPYRKFGASVPDEVKDLLNVSELNFQNQLDKPFLISTTAGEIAKTINRITKAEKVDEWVSELTTEINSRNKSVKLLESDIEQTKESIEALKELNNIGREVDKLKIIKQKHNERTVELNRINELIYQIQEAQKIIVRLKEVKKIEKLITEIEDIEEEIADNNYKEDLLIDLINASYDLEVLSGFDFNVDFEAVEDIDDELVDTDKKILLLERFIESNRELKTVSSKFKEVKKEYEDYLKKIGKCSECGTKLDSKKIKEMLGE